MRQDSPVTFVCTCCGHAIDDVPRGWATPAPDYWSAVPADGDSFLDEELCFIDAPDGGEPHFFIRGNIEIPVHGDGEEPLVYTVWASLSPASFRRAVERWTDADRADDPPFFGWLSTSLPGYPETLSLKTHVHTRPPGLRPLIELEPTDHPLAVEQRSGVPLHRVGEVAQLVGAGARSS
jgi:hypothetical protein